MLGFVAGSAPLGARPEIVAAVVTFDREDPTASPMGLTDEEELLARLRAALGASDVGECDGSDRTEVAHPVVFLRTRRRSA